MNKINLNNLELKIFTEQDALDYCQINNINPDNITELYLQNNRLIDISGIKLFKNIEALYLEYNKLTDISVLNNLNKLETLLISNNQIKDISVLKDLKNLEILNISNNQIKDISVIQYLKNLQILRIDNLELESDLFKYIKNLNNLKKLFCHNGFKDMSVLNKLNNNIETIK